MEKSLSFLDKMKQEFSCEDKDIRTYSPLTLAFVGDCVFDLIIRTVIVERANRSPHDLHKMKSAIVVMTNRRYIIVDVMPNPEVQLRMHL